MNQQDPSQEVLRRLSALEERMDRVERQAFDLPEGVGLCAPETSDASMKNKQAESCYACEESDSPFDHTCGKPVLRATCRSIVDLDAQPSPAAMLAGVLRVVQPRHTVSHDNLRATVWDQPYGKGPLLLDPTSLDSLARVVAMLDGAQRERCERHIEEAWFMSDDGPNENPNYLPHTWTILMPRETLLAALVAAVGLGAEGEGR